MSKSAASKPKLDRFWPWALVAFVLWALLLVYAQPLRQHAAAHLMRSAATRSGTLQLADARLAVVLAPGNDDYRVKLADMYLARGSAAMALDVLPNGNSKTLKLKRAQIFYSGHRYQDVARAITGLQEAEPSILRSMALLELGKASEAAQSALGAHTAAGERQLALCYAVLGDQGGLTGLRTNLSSSDSIAVKAGGLPLAVLLLHSGMPNSARTVLIGSPDNSTAKFSLLALVAVSESRSKDNLAQAAHYLNQGISLDPSNINLHQQLLSVARDQKDLQVINTETSRIHALESGAI